jgi:hypothetical protein
MAYAKSEGDLIKSDNRGVAMASLEAANVLLAETRDVSELLLRQAFFRSEPPNVQSD